MTEDHDAELDEIVAMLASAGLLIETTEDGEPCPPRGHHGAAPALPPGPLTARGV